MAEHFSKLLEKSYGRRLSQWVRFACSFTGNVEDARDVVQEGIRRTMTANPSLRTEGEVNQYVLVAIRTSALKLLKTRARQVPVDERQLRPADSRPGALQRLMEAEESDATKQMAAAAHAEIVRLPPEQRRIVDAVVLRKPPLKLQEVAELEGIAVSTVHKRLKVALASVAAKLRAPV